ncbi:conserved hypothetical protein [Burkholderia pseudomallei 576]|nr:conserved hypothetical protein [Burkholderia pseudomallei 576]
MTTNMPKSRKLPREILFCRHGRHAAETPARESNARNEEKG